MALATGAARVLPIVLLLVLGGTSAAHAAFPGHNGKIAFVSDADGDEEIYTINPDGTGLTQLTHNTVPDSFPYWSPDGSRIIFHRGGVWTMNADGTGEAFTGFLGGTPGWSSDGQRMFYVYPDTYCEADAFWVAHADGTNVEKIPACPAYIIERSRWSPDGQKIVFQGTDGGENWISTINVDGTGLTQITPYSGFEGTPDWSPDGSTIVFAADLGTDDFRLFTVPRNGGAATPLTTGSGDWWPSWSPDGSKIVFWRATSGGDPAGLYIIDSDGTNPRLVTEGAFTQVNQPDWQPIPFTGYPRPQTASPMHVSLALAYNPCTAPNRTHGPPLDSPSCNPPERLSNLTVGTFDSNREAARGVGSVRLRAVGEFPIDLTNGDQSDVEIRVKISDVRNRFDLSDYAGEVGVSAGRRITDRDNVPAPGEATMQDDLFSFAVPCSPTSDPEVGSTCALETTADTLVPGSVKEKQRAVWQLGRISVYDSGPEAGPGSSPVNREFMTQGVFVP